MTIETENQKSVKGRIVAAAWQLFYEKGYNGTTVDDIIDLSGTSKGSFYYYFNTKDELLNTLSMILDDNYEILKEKMDPGRVRLCMPQRTPMPKSPGWTVVT